MNALLSKALAALAVAAGIGVSVWAYSNVVSERDSLKTSIATLGKTIDDLTANQKVTEVVVTKYVKSRESITQRANDVQIEIQKRLPDDPACVLPPDWRVLHDSAATDTAVPTGTADAAPVDPKEAASTIAANYEACNANAEQLRALQQWIGEVK